MSPSTDADGPRDVWELAQENSDVLRYSTLFTARQVARYLSSEEDIDEAIAWCRGRGITHLYLESFRSEVVPPRQVLARARDRFREAGFSVSGCITTSGFARHSTGWKPFSCYSWLETQRALEEMARYAAGLFEEIMIDDFLATDCECERCRATRADRSWSQFRRDLMVQMSRSHIIEAGRQVNPDAGFIIKFPEWHELFHERGYDVERQSLMFAGTWVGTEIRGTEQEGFRTPPYTSAWLLWWLQGIGPGKCGGGWHDTHGTGPRYYLDQDRQTILGGAREVFLFNFGALYEGRDRESDRSVEDGEALLAELPGHFELARLIHGRRPRGLLGWKPMNSPAAEDANLHGLLGMAGFPVTAAHEFDPEAAGFVFGYQVLYDPTWPAAVQQAVASGRPVLATPAFLRGASERDGDAAPLEALRKRAIRLPEMTDLHRWEAMEALDRTERDRMRDAACEALGVTLHAPHGVSIYLFEEDTAVVQSFRDEAAVCELQISGWAGCRAALSLPRGADVPVDGPSPARLELPPRALVVLVRE